MLTESKIQELRKALEQSWSRKTCYPPQREEWSHDLPSIGQCAVTSLLVNDIFGGKIFFNSEYNHFWNETEDGQSIDLTIDQFGDNVKISEKSESLREEILYGRRAEIADTKNRYVLLKKKFKSLLLVEQEEKSAC